MSAIQRLPQVGGTLSIAAGIFAIAGIPSLRQRFTDLLGTGVPGNMLRLLAVAFALLNLKNLPFVWHVSLALPPSPSHWKTTRN
jgi:hypothetical protein